jgi:hypothetical protein
MGAKITRFRSILDIVDYVTTCIHPNCYEDALPGMPCEKHLVLGFAPQDQCPVCGGKTARNGLCHSCSQKLHLLRKRGYGCSILRPGFRISQRCLVPGCNKPVSATTPWPLCNKHIPVAEAHMEGDETKAYQEAINSLRKKPKKVCGHRDCKAPVERLGLCQKHYLATIASAHEFLKGHSPGGMWTAIQEQRREEALEKAE